MVNDEEPPETGELRQQNENLRQVISQMRLEMERLGDHIPAGGGKPQHGQRPPLIADGEIVCHYMYMYIYKLIDRRWGGEESKHIR